MCNLQISTKGLITQMARLVFAFNEQGSDTSRKRSVTSVAFIIRHFARQEGKKRPLSKGDLIDTAVQFPRRRDTQVHTLEDMWKLERLTDFLGRTGLMQFSALVHHKSIKQLEKQGRDKIKALKRAKITISFYQSVSSLQ